MPMEEIHRLTGMQCVIRVCYTCGQIIDKETALSQIEAFAKKYPAVYFSHGLCRECYKLEIAKMEF